ncbi:MAG: PorT family protein [Chitinophagaceae bacterium]|nr:MAG: PorT family protein [Chitinophagaceae bacterium]
MLHGAHPLVRQHLKSGRDCCMNGKAFTILQDCSKLVIRPHLHDQSTKQKTTGMKQLILLAMTIMTACLNAAGQVASADHSLTTTAKGSVRSVGFKAGYNVAKVTGSDLDFSPDTKNGFMIAGFLSPATRSGLGFRTELVFSRQGFGFTKDGKTNTITSDYLYLPQFTTIGITRFVQLQVGGQIGYLLKSSAKKENEKPSDITSFSNRLDYGAAFGVEFYPIKNLILGGRYNISLNNNFKTTGASSGPVPSPLPFNPSDVKTKNAVINFFVGYRF